MTPRKDSMRTEGCVRRDAEDRLAQAKKFLELAGVIATDRDSPAAADGAVSLAILAGIAASDAVCCAALGRRSRSQAHADAIRLLESVEPGGKGAASGLGRLLSIKDKANYGIESVSGKQLDAAMKQAKGLVEYAEDILRR